MILRNRTKPILLKKLDAALPRLPRNFKHRNKLEAEFARRYKGYIGEIKVDGYIHSYFAKNFTILHDVTLKIDSTEIQIDSILISPHAIYILEIKNYNDTIIFNTNLNTFTRDSGEIVTGFRHPISQAESHKFNLMRFLSELGYHDVPVHFFVAVSEPSTVIQVIGDEKAIAKMVSHGEHIPKKIIALEQRYENASNSRINHRKIGEAILEKCYDFDFNILGKYGVNWSSIMPGVHCPACGHLGMERIHSNWKCKRCNRLSKAAHIKTLSDYLLLIKPWITNKECMRFLNINSRNVATRILKASNLEYDLKKRRWFKR